MMREKRRDIGGDRLSFQILGVDTYHILSWFIVYSFLGWIWESSYVSIKNKTWVNRGFVTGPFVTIYGVGAVTVYVILRPIAGHMIELYFAGVAVATILEYLTGVLMETIFHTSWWDYSNKKFNFQGKICLESSIAWGVFTLILFEVFQPIVGDLVELIPRKTGILLVRVWLVGYCIDFAFSASAAFDLHSKMKKLDGVWDEFQDYLRDTRLYEAVEEVRTKAEVYRLELPVGKWNDLIEERKKIFRENLEHYSVSDRKLLEKKESILSKYEEFAQHYGEVKKSIRGISRRHLRAYPNLISSRERRRRLNLKKQLKKLHKNKK